MARSRSGGELKEVTKDQEGTNGKPQEETPAPVAKTPPGLPTEKTASSAALEHKLVVIHGPQGIGKTTLASEWADGNIFFFNTAGELGDLEVYQQPIQSWEDFRSYAWALSETPGTYEATAIDTGDMLGKYCAERVRKKLGIVHESDLDWGKGWSTLRDEFMTNVAKLAAIPNLGVVFVVHSDLKEVKTRTGSYDKWQFRGVKGVRETLLDMADIVLFLNYAEDDDEARVIQTKPSRYWDAKERGKSPRLPATIHWPLGQNGWDIIKAEWKKGDK